jgi:hypothetical protein
MHFTSEPRLSDGAIERDFTLGEIPGILWTPESASAPVPLILLGHPGELRQMYPRLAARARHAATGGFAAATIELPGGGDRPRLAAAEEARADMRRALNAGEPVSADIIDRLVLPLVEQAVPEWQTALDALLSLPEIGGPVGYSGGVSPREKLQRDPTALNGLHAPHRRDDRGRPRRPRLQDLAAPHRRPRHDRRSGAMALPPRYAHRSGRVGGPSDPDSSGAMALQAWNA